MRGDTKKQTEMVGNFTIRYREGDGGAVGAGAGTGGLAYSNTRRVNFPSDSRTISSQASCD